MNGTASKSPKLILQITVDQLRGDLPLRYLDRFGKGGFRQLIETGTWYTSAHHPHSHTVTVVGHTTLATGAYPSSHGIIQEKWISQQPEQPQMKFEKLSWVFGEPPAGLGLHETDAIEAEVAKVAEDGLAFEELERSPKQILTTTFADELTIATNNRSKCFSVSLKDRAAIPMAGRNGKAFWFSDKTGGFESSSYYYKRDLPDWAKAWNKRRRPDDYSDQSWDLLNKDASTYLFGDQYCSPPSYLPEILGKLNFDKFPHQFGSKNEKFFHNLWKTSPVGDQLTSEFAKELIENESLGRHDGIDYLSVSFSSTDMVGHMFGPASLQSEDVILQLDRTLDDLFSFIDGKVGLENTLIVLAADHGCPEPYQYLNAMNDFDIGGIKESELESKAKEAVRKAFGTEAFIKHYLHPSIYLDRSAILDKGIDQVEVERVIVRSLMSVKGVALAVSATDLRRGGQAIHSEIIDALRRNLHPKRSGDIYILEEPLWNIGSGQTLIGHGSPWPYDTYVPVAFAGAGIPARRISRKISTVDIAPTLSILSRAKFPSACVGTPLIEILDLENGG